MPALDYLEVYAAELGLNSEMNFFWFTGALSRALDNAHTYLAFLAAALGRHHLSLNSRGDVQKNLRHITTTSLSPSRRARYSSAR